MKKIYNVIYADINDVYVKAAFENYDDAINFLKKEVEKYNKENLDAKFINEDEVFVAVYGANVWVEETLFYKNYKK